MADIVLNIGPPLGAWYLRLVRLTGRYRVKGLENVEKAKKASGNAVWVVWHNRLLGAIALHQGRSMGTVISKSRDGEIISRVVERMGYKALRGSTSRGGALALKAVLRHAREGHDVVFTPDGPRGPRYKVQQGAAYAALRAGIPVLPVGVGASPKVVFRSWDRFQLPLPFGRVQVVYGEPLRFAEEEPIEAVMEKIEAALMSVTEEADRLLGVESP